MKKEKELRPMVKMWAEEFEEVIGRTEYETIPPRTLQALKRFVLEGTPTGGFLEAVLNDELFLACASADQENSEALKDIVKLIYNHLPIGCWGRDEQYEEWREKGGLLG